jgi:hypothetical protein
LAAIGIEQSNGWLRRVSFQDYDSWLSRQKLEL